MNRLKVPVDFLDRLTMDDILSVRKNLFEVGFNQSYDELVRLLKGPIHIANAKELLFRQESINNLTLKIHHAFVGRIRYEFGLRNQADKEKALVEIALNLLEIASTVFAPVVKFFQIIPSATTIVSPTLRKRLDASIEAARVQVNSLVDWSADQRTSFMDGYCALRDHENRA